MSLGRRAIGGDFELATISLGSPDRLGVLTRGLVGTWTASGRSALALVLRHLISIGVRHIHLPAYLCESILRPIQALGLEYSFYPVDSCLEAHPSPPSNSAVLLIHYFGWLNSATPKLRAEAGRAFILIEDASQALLSDWGCSEAVSRFLFLSPRKFCVAPLGGWCNLQADPGSLQRELEVLFWRSMTARLIRGIYLAERDGEVEMTVEDFCLESQRALESYLDAHPLAASMPQFVLQVLAGLDWNDVASRRRENWTRLNESLAGQAQPLIPNLPANVVPLGYPVVMRERDRVRSRLAEQRIFCPVHWRLPVEVSASRFPEAISLSQGILTLPIDQRYGSEDVDYLVQHLKQAL